MVRKRHVLCYADGEDIQPSILKVEWYRSDGGSPALRYGVTRCRLLDTQIGRSDYRRFRRLLGLCFVRRMHPFGRREFTPEFKESRQVGRRSML